MKNISTIFMLIGIVFVNINEIRCYPNESEGISENGFDIQALIEKILIEIKTRLPEIFIFSDIHMFVPQNKFFWGRINLSNISLSGLKEFNATVLYHPLIPIPKGYIITVDQLHWNMDYKTNVTLFNTQLFSIFGEGSTKTTLNNLKIDGNVSISVLPINASATFEIDLKNVTFNISGLLADEEFSKEFGSFLEKSVNHIIQIIEKPVSNFLTYVLNRVIQTVLQSLSPHNTTYIQLDNQEIK